MIQTRFSLRGLGLFLFFRVMGNGGSDVQYRVQTKKAYFGTEEEMAMHPYHMQWFMDEERKRKEQHQENDIDRLNREFSNLIQKLSYQVERKKYAKEEMLYNRQLVSSSIWQLGYRNNFINPKVLTLQAGWLLHILKEEKGLGTIDNENYLEREISNLIHRIRNVDMQAYQEVHRKYPEARSIL